MADFKLGRLKFKWKGNWAGNNIYYVDDIVLINGNSYVCVTNHTSSATKALWYSNDYANWQLYLPGVNPSGTYSSGTTYYLNDIVQYQSSSWISIANSNTGNAPSTISSYWNLLVQGTGDLATTNIYYVSSATGNDTYDGSTVAKAFKTLRYACSQVTGPATIYVKTGTYYEILPITIPAGVSIIGDSMRDTQIAPLTGTASSVYVPTGSSGTTLKVVSTAGIGVGMTVTGTGFTNTLYNAQKVLAVVDSATLTLSAPPNTTPSGTLTFTYYSTDASPVVNNLSTMFYLSDSVMLQQLLLTGMTGFAFNGSAPTDITQASIGGVYLRLNPATTITVKSPYVKDCTAKSSGGVGAIIDGTAQSGGITSMVFWAYNMVLDGGVGIWAANGGKVEAVSCFTYYAYMGYTTSGGGQIRSLSGNNSYGNYGVVSSGYLASETPVTGTVYGNMLTVNSTTIIGTFQQGEVIRQLNTSGSINITSATCSGTTATVNYTNQGSAPFSTGQYITVAGVGAVSGYNVTALVLTSTATSTTYTVSPGSLSNGTPSTGTITGNASAYVTSAQSGYLYFKQSFGTFNTTNTVTGVTSAATMIPSAVGGQNNYLIVLSSLSATPAVGASIQFTGDTSAYVIQAVSTATVNSVAITIITLAQQKSTTSSDGVSATIRYNFSLIRLQGHDFLYIGTGNAAATNYPNVVAGNAVPANQILFTFPGRVYYVATDQAGNFNVGQYFSVNQATGSATLNASAFNLSGLTSLRLGSIGAQLGAQVNEFSTDGTLSQNSDVKVPTQHAVTTYLGAIQSTVNPYIAPATDLAVDLGTPTKRFGHVYVGPGSITIGTLTLTDSSGTLQVQAGATNAPTNINSINNGTSNVTVANSGSVTIASAGTTQITATSSGVTIAGTLTVNGATEYIQGTNTVFTDNLLEIHAPTGGVGGTWVSSDGKDIGLRMHYYANSADQNAALLLANDSGYLEWYNTGTENGSGDFVSASYGTIKAATFLATTSTATTATSFNHINTTATTVNEYGAATTISVASSAASATTWTLGNTSNNNTLTINGNGTAGTATLSSNVTAGTTNLFTNNTGTVYVGGSGAGLQIGVNNGNSTLQIQGNGAGGTATITSNISSGTANIFTSVTGTINVGTTSGTINIGGAGATVYTGGYKPASTGKAIAMSIVFGG